MTQALSDDFDSAFGRAFARAYEQAQRETQPHDIAAGRALLAADWLLARRAAAVVATAAAQLWS